MVGQCGAAVATDVPEKYRKNNRLLSVVKNGVQVVGGSNPLTPTKKSYKDRRVTDISGSVIERAKGRGDSF